MSAARKILVLYTGGTLGMQMTDDGLAPASGFGQCLSDQQRQETGRHLPEWQFRELSPPIDSADMQQKHWLTISATISQAVTHDGFDAALVLHGTDTLAYSAAALSFLLLGLGVPVILTGAMQPADIPGSDAWSNVFGAMQCLGEGIAPGVYLYFHGTLMHGARCSKLSSERADAFCIWPRQRQAQSAGTLPAALRFDQPRQPVGLAILPLHPGIRAELIQALTAAGIRGLLLECYGSGTGPTADDELLAVLRQAHESGMVILAISQCPQGHIDFSRYAAGNKLARCGIISAGGMTREAALGKLFAILGTGMEQTQAEHWLMLDLCGEMNECNTENS